MKEKRKRETILLVLCIIFFLCFFYLLMLNLWGLSIVGTSIDYTRFGTWSNALSGIGTTSALMVALASLISQRAIYNSGEKRRILESETAIYLWMTSKEIRNDNDKFVTRFWDLRIQNSTIAPIYHWKATFDSFPDHICNSIKRPLLPGENIFNLPFFDNLDQNNVPESRIVFEGKSGRYWNRSSKGGITEATIENIKCTHQSNLINQ